MNKTISIGTVVRDPEVRYSQEGMAIARWTMALRNSQKKDDGTYGADFPSFNAFGKRAEFVEKYVRKGTKLAVFGHIKTGSYTNKDGVTVYTTDIVADEIEFAGGKSESQNTQESIPSDEFMNIPDGLVEELPFH